MLHFAWENVTQLDTVWGSKYSIYSSLIFYQNRNTLGEYSLPFEIGKGFVPDIKIKNNDVYIFFVAADSSNQQMMQLSYCKGDGQTFSPPIPLQQILVNPYSFSDLAYRLSQFNFRWDVDITGNIHVAWRETYPINKTFVLHYSSVSGLQIDSIDDANAQVRFMDNGEVRIFSVIPSLGSDSTQFICFVSQLGSSLDTVNTLTSPPNVSLNQILVDADENDHAIVNEGTKSFLLKYASTDSAQVLSLSGEYTINPSSYVDTNNLVWLTGKRDSTSVMLNFSFSDIGTHQDFTFPLRVGNEWHYLVYQTEIWEPDILPKKNIDAVIGDTIMTNSQVYFIVSSTLFVNKYYRKEGFRIFQFNPTDNKEYLCFDFSRNPGDTITTYDTSGVNNIILQSVEDHFLFDATRRTYEFLGGVTIGNGHEYFATISDGIGISQFSDGLSYSSNIIGSKINGKIYGTLLSIDEESERLPLSFSLTQNYPNPFNPSTTINFSLPNGGNVSLKVYDILGKEVAVLVNGYKNAGTYSVTFNASQLSSGVYFYRIQSGRYVSTKKLTLLR